MHNRPSGIAAFVVAGLAAVLLPGCGQQAAEAPTPAAVPTAPSAEAPPPPQDRERAAPVMTLTDADDGRTLSLRRGEVFEVRLPAERIAGYAWIPAENPMPVIGTDGVPLYEVDEGLPDSAPGIEVWRFIGRSAGHAHLVFEYRRPWESDTPPHRTVSFHLDVE